MQSENVRVLQSKLLDLGYISVQPTGYFGSMTTTAVKWLQRENGLVADGVAGSETLICIDRLLSKPKSSPTRSNSGGKHTNSLVWWRGKHIFVK